MPNFETSCTVGTALPMNTVFRRYYWRSLDRQQDHIRDASYLPSEQICQVHMCKITMIEIISSLTARVTCRYVLYDSLRFNRVMRSIAANERRSRLPFQSLRFNRVMRSIAANEQRSRLALNGLRFNRTCIPGRDKVCARHL